MKKYSKTVYKQRVVVTILMIAVVLIGCEDVFEKNITGERVHTIFPSANDTIRTSEVTFSWSELEGAKKYRLQVNNENSKRIMDTLVETLYFPIGLESGNYVWNIRAENFAYETAFLTPINFRVEAVDDLSIQKIDLLSPSDQLYVNDPAEINLTWTELKYADSYTLSIDRKKTSGTANIILVEGITTPSTTVNPSLLDEDGEYVWKVRAVNESTQTAFVSKSFFIDTTLPVSPLPASPVEDQELVSVVEFSWSNPNDVGEIHSSIITILEIGTDEAFGASPVVYEVDGESKQLHTFDSVGEYYWRIKTQDLAGNESTYSEVRKFIIK